MSDKTGGPAFPIRKSFSDDQPLSHGMTLWDWYAGNAIAGFAADSTTLAALGEIAASLSINPDAAIAHTVADYADAMLAERKKRGIL